MVSIGRTLLVLAAALFVVAPTVRAQELGDDDGPVYLIVSLNDEPLTDGDGTFAYDTTVTMVNIGTMAGGGPEVGDVRFLLAASLPLVPLPTVEGFDLEDLGGNQATILGSFQTSEETDPAHIVSGAPPGAFEGGIPPEVQAAVFAATRDPLFVATLLQEEVPNEETEDPDDTITVPKFPTTKEVAEFIEGYLPEESALTAEDIAGFVFETDITVAASPSTCEAEGGLFPHTPGDEIFNFRFAFDDAGEFSAIDICLLVDIDIKPGSSTNPINLKKKGVLPVAILSSDTFDATDIDEGTAAIVGVVDGSDVSVGPVVKNNGTFQCSVEDVDGDGDDDLICHFSVQALIDAGLLGTSTTELTIRAEDVDGACFTGTDVVDPK